MVGIIKNLLGGNDETDGKKSGKKKNGFFLELDREQGVWLPPSDKQQESSPDTPQTEAAAAPTPAAAPAPAASAPAPSATPSEPDTTFAPEFLVPRPTPGRRRPGANLEMFKSMAREVRER